MRRKVCCRAVVCYAPSQIDPLLPSICPAPPTHIHTYMHTNTHLYAAALPVQQCECSSQRVTQRPQLLQAPSLGRTQRPNSTAGNIDHIPAVVLVTATTAAAACCCCWRCGILVSACRVGRSICFLHCSRLFNNDSLLLLLCEDTNVYELLFTAKYALTGCRCIIQPPEGVECVGESGFAREGVELRGGTWTGAQNAKGRAEVMPVAWRPPTHL